MRTFIPGSIAFCAVLLFSTCGCGTGPAGAVTELVPVKGKITYKGHPLTKGLVVFEPRNYGRAANGEIKSDGSYELTTVEPGDGAVPGKHRVYVTDTGTGSAGKHAKELVARKYTQPNTSGLDAEVSREKTEYNFDIR